MFSADPPSIDDQCYRLAVQSVAAGMAVIDLEGRWVDINPALARLLGHDAAGLRGQLVARCFDPGDADAVQVFLRAFTQTPSPPNTLPQRFRNQDGDIVMARADVSVMRDADGAPCYLVMHLQPLEPRHDEMQALRESLAASEQAMQALTEQQDLLARGFSHDLRAPLRAIESFSALLESNNAGALDERGRDHLQRVRAAAEDMGRLIDSLLDLSRIDGVELAPEPVDISMLADWVAADLQDAEPQRRAEIDVAKGLWVAGNERLLRMLLQQLLDNAWRFSDGDQTVRIEVDGAVVGDRLQVAVRDHGRGFDMRHVDKIFQPFQRLHAPEQGGGHGIGLAIAKRIIERHGGRIRAKSEPSGGSVFTFELPAAKAEENKSGLSA